MLSTEVTCILYQSYVILRPNLAVNLLTLCNQFKLFEHGMKYDHFESNSALMHKCQSIFILNDLVTIMIR